MWPTIIYTLGFFMTGSPIWPLMCLLNPGILEYLMLGIFIWSFWW